MPYVFIDDGAPEARDYDSNWLYYCEDDLEDMEAALSVMEGRGGRGRFSAEPALRALRRAIERKRAAQNTAGRRRSSRGILSRLSQRLIAGS